MVTRWKAQVGCVAVLLFGLPVVVSAQESALKAELRREGERVSDACGTFSFTSIPGCAYTLFTDHPLHIAAGSLPPQNGFGFGGAFVWSKNTKDWRMSWDVDAVGATTGAWRAGGDMKLVHTPPSATRPIIVTTPARKARAQGTYKPQETVTASHTELR